MASSIEEYLANEYFPVVLIVPVLRHCFPLYHGSHIILDSLDLKSSITNIGSFLSGSGTVCPILRIIF